jgi:hypothetical protein
LGSKFCFPNFQSVYYFTSQQTRGRKGSGFHVNLLVVAIMVLISSFLGLPWMCLAAVETSVHLDSLKVWSSFDAPGVKSHVVKIREQRLTLFFTGILVGEYQPGFLKSVYDFTSIYLVR